MTHEVEVDFGQNCLVQVPLTESSTVKRQSGGLNHKLEGIKTIFSQQGLKGERVNIKFLSWKAVCSIAGMPTCRHQRWKNPVSVVAMLPGKDPTIRRI